MTKLLENFVPLQYRKHTRVFDNQELKKFTPPRPWDHTIKLKEGAPTTLISQNIQLSQTKLEELWKFLKEHLQCRTIRLSKSPYATAFFFIKKKNGKLCPIQDY